MDFKKLLGVRKSSAYYAVLFLYIENVQTLSPMYTVTKWLFRVDINKAASSAYQICS